MATLPSRMAIGRPPPSSPGWPDRPLRVRRSDQRHPVPGLCRAVLAPTLAAGDILILDNLGRHKVEGVRQAVEARGAQFLFLPPYSPDLNPIEKAFAKLKAFLRKAAERTVDRLWAAIASLIDLVTPPQECLNVFKAAGYAR